MNKAIQFKKVYSGIDVVKLIAAVLVVVLHAVETTDYFACGVKYVITRFAVPFFFIVSGFFFYKGIQRASNKKEYFIKYEKHIIKLFIIWALVIYSPFTIYEYVHSNSGESMIKIAGMLIRRIFVIGPGPYWYLVALFWSAVFLYYCYMKKNNCILYIGILTGFFFEIAYSCFRGILSEISIFEYIFKLIYFVFSWEFNFLMFGIPFMGIGYFIAQRDITISNKTAVYMAIVTTLIRIIEYILPQLLLGSFWNKNQISVAYIFQAISIFLLSKNLNLNIKKETSLKLRQMSSCIYFSHVIFLYNILNPILDNYTTLPTYASSMIIWKVAIVLLACMVLFGIILKINNKHLNILING